MSNRHPIDELADIRQQVGALQTREAFLKDQILATLPEPPRPGEPVKVAGDDYAASVSLVTTERLDRKSVEAALSKPKFAACLKASTSITIRTVPRAADREAA